MSEEEFDSFYKSWFRIRDEAQESGDFSFYKKVLLEIIKDFTRFYGTLTTDEGRSLVEQYLKFARKDLRAIEKMDKEKELEK